jgi:hypothetical protein
MQDKLSRKRGKSFSEYGLLPGHRLRRQEDIRWLLHPQFLFNWEELKLTVAPPANKKRHGFVNGSW